MPLARRLAAIDREVARSEPVADWTQVLAAVLDNAAAATATQPAPGGNGALDNLPFAHALLPFLDVGRTKFRERTGHALDGLGGSARDAIELQLLSHLSFVANLAFATDFSLFRFQQTPLFAFEELWRQGPPSTRIYELYVDSLAQGGLARFLLAYPVLARLLCQSVDQWAEAFASLCLRFARDRELLETELDLGPIPPSGGIVGIRPDLSDRHHGGTTVCRLDLASGKSVIYKPRNLAPELAFYEVLGLLNAAIGSDEFRFPHCIDRKEYGWSEFVQHTPCGCPEELRTYYRRSGMLLAVIYLFAVTDIHFENVIACAGHPIVIDLETMLNDWVAADRPAWNVTETGLVPRGQVAPDGHVFDISGLGADRLQRPAIDRRAWTDINTDRMHMADPAPAPLSAAHLPTGGGTAPLRDHLRQILDGFRDGYQHLVRNRDLLLDNQPLLARLDRLELRVLMRGTTTYTELQLRTLHPEFLTNGIDRSIELEWLARPLTGPSPPHPERIQVYEVERAAMERLDVPRFTTAGSTARNAGSADPELEMLHPRPGSAVLRRRLGRLGPDDLENQLDLIRSAILEHDLRQPPSPGASRQNAPALI